MTIDEILNQALGFFEALRRTGFSADDIYFGADPWQVWIELRTQGKSFICICGDYFGSHIPLLQAWEKKAEWWNSSSTPEGREALWKQSFAFNHAGEFLSAIVVKGIELPMPLKGGWENQPMAEA